MDKLNIPLQIQQCFIDNHESVVILGAILTGVARVQGGLCTKFKH